MPSPRNAAPPRLSASPRSARSRALWPTSSSRRWPRWSCMRTSCGGRSPTSPPPCSSWTSSRTRRAAASNASAPSCTPSTPTPRVSVARPSRRWSPLVRAVVDRPAASLRGSAITLKGASGDPRVALGENDLRSVIGNLVVNALEVSGGKGPVDVRLSSDADRVRLRVADKGPGLPDGDVFAAFYSTKSSGTGLGSVAGAPPGRGGRRQHRRPRPARRRRRVRGRAAAATPRAAARRGPARRRGRRAPARRLRRRARKLRRVV